MYRKGKDGFSVLHFWSVYGISAHAKCNSMYIDMQMGHATAEAVVRAGLQLVPVSFTGASEAVAVGNVGVSGIPVELVHPGERQSAMESVIAQYPGLVLIDFTLPSVVNGEHFQSSETACSQCGNVTTEQAFAHQHRTAQCSKCSGLDRLHLVHVHDAMHRLV